MSLPATKTATFVVVDVESHLVRDGEVMYLMLVIIDAFVVMATVIAAFGAWHPATKANKTSRVMA